MKKYLNKYLLIFVIVVAVLAFWYGINSRNIKDPENPVLPETKISTLPDDIKGAVESIALRAEKLGTKNGRGLFNLLKQDEISKDTPLVLQTYYSKSDQISEYVTSMPASFAGLTIEQLESTLREWNIEEYNPKNTLILRRRKERLSPEDRNNQHIGIKDGRVVIFYGKKDKRNNKVIKQKTSIKVEDLPQSEREKLKDGIDIKSKEELFTILEGLLSFKQD